MTAEAAGRAVTNKHGTVILVGQVWADNDPRCTQRTIRVTGLEPGPPIKAICTVLTDSYGNTPARPKTVRINIDRMHLSTGYRLLTPSGDGSDTPAPAGPPQPTP